MKRRMVHPFIVLSIAVALLTLSALGLSAQFQPIVPDIGFEIEGNTALDFGGDYDWENSIFPPAIYIEDPNSKIATDFTTFHPNGKFDYPAGWSIMPGNVGPSQSELTSFLVWDIAPGELGNGRPNDHWLVLGMERTKEPGFFELDFEYNQAAWDGSSGGLIRTPGDVLVGFELRGKATSKMAQFKVLLLQYWPGAQPSLCSTTLGPGGEPESVVAGTDPCPAYGGSGWYYRLLADEALSAESGLVQATMNKDLFAPLWPSTDSKSRPWDIMVIGPHEFAEAAINLTALDIEPECLTPGSVHAKSRSAPHVHSDLKDLVGPVTVMDECARLDGHKFEDVDGDGLWGTNEPPLGGWEIRLSDGSVTHTDTDGYYAFEDLAYGTYTVSEVCPQDEDWVQTAPTPDNPGSCGDGVYAVELDSGNLDVNNLDFGNHLPADLVVSKDVHPSFTRTYEWTLTKVVDNPGPILLYPGDYAEVEYTVVAESVYVDSNWAVEGTITIENLGTADVVLASVTDVISPGDIQVPVDCEVWTVPALGSITCAYGPVSLPDGAARTNTVTVMVQGSVEEWSAPADIVFGDPTTEYDKEARITDTNWEDEQWEGPEWVDVEYPGNAKDPIIYPWKIWASGDECDLLEYPNMATLVTGDTGTVLTYSANVQILEVCEVTLVYEDLRIIAENDWDYNDLVVHMPISLTVSDAGDLEAVNFKATLEPLQTSFKHTVNLQPYEDVFACGGTYTTVVTDKNGTTTPKEDEPYGPGDNLLLIPDTRVAGDDAAFLVELTIKFDVPTPGACPYSFGDPDPISQFHGEWLFFDPWITVYRPDLPPPDNTYDIHVSRDEPEPRILTVPADWVAPEKDWIPIWCVYCNGVQKGEDGLPEFTAYWWNTEICSCNNCEYNSYLCALPECQCTCLPCDEAGCLIGLGAFTK